MLFFPKGSPVNSGLLEIKRLGTVQAALNTELPIPRGMSCPVEAARVGDLAGGLCGCVQAPARPGEL